MTNFTSIAGGALWMAVATLLMLAALEPVVVESVSAPAITLADANASANRAA